MFAEDQSRSAAGHLSGCHNRLAEAPAYIAATAVLFPERSAWANCRTFSSAVHTQ
jgi:hypothetical protein